MTLHPETFEHPRPTDKQMALMARVRGAATGFADVLQDSLPAGPDKTYVLRALRTITMWANAAITRHPDGAPRVD